MKNNRINQKGFTLIELLAVIVILAILMTLAVTSMQRYINNAKKDTYITTAQQFLDSVRLGVTNGDYDTPDIGACTVVAVSSIETTTDTKQSPYGKSYDDTKSFVIVHNSASAGSETKLDYYMAMVDSAANGFPITKESSLARGIVFTRDDSKKNKIIPITATTTTAYTDTAVTCTKIENYYK